MADRHLSDLSPEFLDQLLAGVEAPAPAVDARGTAPLLAAAARVDDAAVVPHGLKPAVVVCVGGSGLQVGLNLRRNLDRFVQEAGYSVAARQRAESVALLGV